MALHDTFQQLSPGMTPEDVESRVGVPDEIDDSTMPTGSGFGTQDTFVYKILPGEPVLQWTYWDDQRDHAVWFAKRSDRWILTLRLSAPLGVLTERTRG
jgi:hypothetical protein